MISRARPLEKGGATAVETGRVASVQQHDHREWTSNEIGWVVNRSAEFDRPGKIAWLEGSISEIIFFAREPQRTGRSWIWRLRECELNAAGDEQQEQCDG